MADNGKEAAFQTVGFLCQLPGLHGFPVQPDTAQRSTQLPDDIGTRIEIARTECHKPTYIVIDLKRQDSELVRLLGRIKTLRGESPAGKACDFSQSGWSGVRFHRGLQNSAGHRIIPLRLVISYNGILNSDGGQVTG